MMKTGNTALAILLAASLLLAGCGPSKPDGYEVRGGEVYYGRTVYVFFFWYQNERKVADADAKTFSVMTYPGYGKDAAHVFYEGTLLPGSDATTFKALDERMTYAADAGQIYHRAQVVAGADAASFEIVDAKRLFARDKGQVYRGAVAVAGADPETYELVGEGEVGRDRKDYYLGTQPVNVRDKDSLKILIPDGSWHDIWAWDKQAYYVGADATPIADAASFEVLEYGYAKDARQVYYLGAVVTGADAGTFQLVAKGYDREYGGYGKDAGKVYYLGTTLEGADVETFAVDKEGVFRDKNRRYERGQPVEETKAEGKS